MENRNMFGADSLRYSGIPTLLRRPLLADPAGVDIGLIGVPYDGATENRPGPRHGPREIRNMSSFTRSIHHVTRINPFDLCNVADLGDVNFSNPFVIEKSFEDITKFLKNIVKAGAIPLSVGGDHSITLPILRAIVTDQPLGLVHIDAHTDMSDHEFGHKYTHGTPFRRAIEENLIDPQKMIQIGIRGAQNSEESWKASEDLGVQIIYIEEFNSLGIEGMLSAIKKRIGNYPSYLSFDIDSVDPAFAPGTGTPEIGGITPIQAQALIRGLEDLNFVGGDLVEVSPPFDPTGNTALLGATLLYEIVCIIAKQISTITK